MSTTAAHRCPRCSAVHPGPVFAGVEVACDTCGHRWLPKVGSDEYMPAEGSGAQPIPLTERRAPTPHRKQPSSGGLPFDRLEAEARRDGSSPRPVSELSFRPSTDNLSSGRTSCPVCGHSFVGRPGDDEQRCPACGTSFVHSTGRLTPGGAAGDRLIGRVLRGCQIDRKLGEGGMGAVYHARQLSLDRSVAIKVLPPELARNRNFIQRFEREAKSLARINHANILQIYDFGEDTQLGVYFMVIEYVDGWDLGEVLRRQPTLSQIETLDIVRQALLGLEQAAEKGVIHRDIKPDNLMVALSGLCKVSDFGLAKGSAGDSEVTSVGVRVGTPAFMSPEQCDGVEVDSRSDVYNLGCTAFLMLTGRLPYDGETPFSIMLKHKVDPVPSVRTHRPELDQRVDVLIRRMMGKRPDDRCFELRELIDDSEKLLVALTGTSSVLRKTNGPIRALAQQATGQGSSGKRGASSVMSGISSDAGSAPLSGARPSGRQRAAVEPPSPSSRTAPEVVPDWLRPVDGAPPLPQPPPPVAMPSPPPQVGSRTSPAPAVGSRTAPARSVRPTASGSQVMPVGGLPTPFPGVVTALPQDRRNAAGSSSSSVGPGAMDRVRERGIRAEVASIAAGAERLAAAGSLDQAASEWKRASSLARDTGESRRLADLAADAKRRASRRRRVRALAITVISLVLIGVNLWIWPPVLHGLLAERERARIEAIPDERERIRSLREFAAANQGGWRWYRIIFQRGYEVPAAAAAASSADAPRSVPRLVPPPRPPPPPVSRAAPAQAMAELDALAADPAVTLGQVAEAAKPLAGLDARAAAILEAAEAAIAAATAARAAIDEARRSGRHGEALDLAAAMRRDHPRAGAPLLDLPLPARLRALDTDHGGVVAAVRFTVDGVEVVGDDGRFCRSVAAETVVEVAAPGYAASRMLVPPDADPAERTVEVRLGAAPLWRLAAPTVRPAWIRLHAAAASLVVVSPEVVTAVDPASGNARALTLPGTRMMPWWRAVDGGWVFATADGEQRQVLPAADRAVPVRRLGGAPIALVEFDLVYRAGGRLAVAVEVGADGRHLIARDGAREVWRLNGLQGTAEPVLRRVDDKLLLIDDLSLRLVEEDGTVASTLALQAARSGPWAALPDGRLLIATGTGVDLVQPVPGGAHLVAHPWLREAGAAVPATAGDVVLLARQAQRGVDLATWAGDLVQPRWHAALTGRPVQVSLGHGVAAVIDEAGVITVLSQTDGTVLRRVAHGVAPATAPLLLPGLVVIADQTGAVAGYRF